MPTGKPISQAHSSRPWVVRVTHWINAFAMVCMALSGFAIYNASPLFGFKFPGWMTLGGWLGGALAWHFAMMWLLVLNAGIYFGFGCLSGYFRRSFLPLSFASLRIEVAAAFALRLPHAANTYNMLQRSFYVGVLLLGAMAVVSGAAIWKPVQFQHLTHFLGGYEAARHVHFFVMAGIVGFITVHLAMVAIVPSTLGSMISGRAWRSRSGEDVAQ
jgi:thiosulfate reductase cytochrome b subunit